jgi:hypothetical protein
MSDVRSKDLASDLFSAYVSVRTIVMPTPNSLHGVRMRKLLGTILLLCFMSAALADGANVKQ